jgi:large subunit ribosomal protein L10
MPRPEKVQAVADIKERLETASAVFLAEYAGLSVQDQQTLRRSLKRGGAEFKVVKMTLARRAAADLDIEELDELLWGPTGIAFASEDAVMAAKALRDFAKDHEVFTIKGGLLGRDFLSPERINELAEVESREVLLSQIVGAMQAPLAKLAGLMAALPRGMATAMQQLIDKMPAEPESEATPEPDAAPREDAEAPVSEADAGEADVSDDDDSAAAEEPAADEPAETEDSAEEASDDSDADAAADDGDDSAAAEEPAADELPMTRVLTRRPMTVMILLRLRSRRLMMPTRPMMSPRAKSPTEMNRPTRPRRNDDGEDDY